MSINTSNVTLIGLSYQYLDNVTHGEGNITCSFNAQSHVFVRAVAMALALSLLFRKVANYNSFITSFHFQLKL